MTRGARTGLALAIAAIAISSLFAASRIAERGRFATPYSTYSTGPDGARALLLLARAIGHRAEPLTREISDLPPGTLVILTGCRAELLRKLARPERDALQSWVEQGGLLIVAGDAKAVPEAAGLHVSERAHCEKPDERGLIERLIAQGDPELEPASILPANLVAEAIGPPLTHLLPFSVSEPLTLRVGHDQEATELLSSDVGPLALTAPFGRGRVVLLGIPEALTNRALTDGGGLVFARLLRAFAPRGPVLFDEYHLGMGERRSLMGYLRDAGYTPLLLQLFAVALAALLAGAARIAPARDEPALPGDGRSFAEAFANLLSRSHDTRGMLRRLAGEALSRIARHYQARRVAPEQLGAWLSAQGRFAVAHYVRSIREHAERPLSPGETLTLRAQAIERDETAAIVVGEAR